MPIREKFGLGYLTSEGAASKEGERRDTAQQTRSSWGGESVRSALAVVAEKVLVALRARSAPAELSDLVSLTGYTFDDLLPVLRVLTDRGLITSQSGRIELTTLGQQTHTLS